MFVALTVLGVTYVHVSHTPAKPWEETVTVPADAAGGLGAAAPRLSSGNRNLVAKTDDLGHPNVRGGRADDGKGLAQPLGAGGCCFRLCASRPPPALLVSSASSVASGSSTVPPPAPETSITFAGREMLMVSDLSEQEEMTVFMWLRLSPTANNDAQTVLANRATGCDNVPVGRLGLSLYVNSLMTADGKLKVKCGHQRLPVGCVGCVCPGHGPSCRLDALNVYHFCSFGVVGLGHRRRRVFHANHRGQRPGHHSWSVASHWLYFVKGRDRRRVRSPVH